jgi:hypothetical protein
MIIKKKVDLGEYIVDISYDNETGFIEVSVLDELHEVIESITITNSTEDESDNSDESDNDYIDFNIGLN